MKDQSKTKTQLIEELETLRKQVVKLKKMETKRKLAEEALRGSEEKFATAFRNSPDSITLIGLSDERVVEVNDGFCRATGYRREEILGRTSLELNLWSDLSERARFVSMLRDEKRVIGFEASFRIKSGEIRVGLAAGEVVQIGDEPFALITIRDITDHKRAEEGLKKEKDRAQKYLDIAGVMLVAINTDQEVVLINRKGCEILGYKEDEIIGRNWFDHFIPERDRKSVKAVFARLVAAEIEPVEHFENTVLTKSGMEKIIAWHNTLITDEKGHIMGTLSSGEDVTERKKAEEALKESEKKYRLVVQNATEIIYTTDIKGNFRYANPTALKVVGYSHEELQRLNYLDLVVPEYRDRLKEVYGNQFRARQATTYVEFPFFNKFGEVMWFGQSASLMIEGNRIIGFQIIARDITERKRAEDALRESEEKYRTLVETSPDAITLLDLSLNVVMTNRPALTLYGCANPEEVIGQSALGFISPEDRPRAVEDARKMFETGNIVNLEYTLLKKGGVPFPAEVRTSLILNAEKKPLAFICVSRDVSERKQADEALHMSEKRFKELFDEAPVGYFECDAQGRIASVNRTELEMLGYTTDEMIGHPLWEFVVGEETVRQQILGKLAGTIPPARGLERTYKRKDQTILPVLVEDRLLRDGNGKITGLRSTIQDITERKRAEEEKAVLQEQLRQSQKIEAIGRLAGGVAHDFNNLLTVIKGYSQLSLVEIKDDSPLKEDLEEIKKAAEKAADLTRQLLAFSRRQILEMKVLDLNAILGNMDRMLHRLIGEDIGLITLLADALGRVKTDPGWVEQIIMNLAVNARDAMPNGGKLTIETANVNLDEAYAHGHIAVKPGRYVMLSMSDTGVGMTPEVSQQVFEPFFTTKEKGKGTGLGLSTVYGIVKQSGGNIWIYSEPGHGTTFKIYLPRVDEPADELKDKVVVEELPRGSETILVVEDEEEVRKVAVRILKRQGYTVFDTPDGEGALVACEKRKEPLHLILTDVVMPGMSGRQLVERCRQIRQDFKVLYMSGYTDNAIVQHGVLVEGVNYIQKPFTVDALARKVREALDK